MNETAPMTDTDKALADVVQKNLDMFRPILQSEGGDASLLSVKEGVATIFMDDSGCSGCGSTPMQVLAPGMARTLIEKVAGLTDVVFKYPGE